VSWWLPRQGEAARFGIRQREEGGREEGAMTRDIVTKLRDMFALAELLKQRRRKIVRLCLIRKARRVVQ
jgi:hypothetical protein